MARAWATLAAGLLFILMNMDRRSAFSITLFLFSLKALHLRWETNLICEKADPVVLYVNPNGMEIFFIGVGGYRNRTLLIGALKLVKVYPYFKLASTHPEEQSEAMPGQSGRF